MICILKYENCEGETAGSTSVAGNRCAVLCQNCRNIEDGAVDGLVQLSRTMDLVLESLAPTEMITEVAQ